MLKMTGMELEKISDIDKYLFIEKATRGGVSYIAKRYAKASNKYMNDYDPKKPSTFIISLDKNNLHGWSMSEYLPYKKFEWLENIDKFDVMSVNEKSDIGYILEVDLEYPKELHELHNDYPLGPEKLAVSSDMLLEYCKKIADEYYIKVGDVKKLLPNFSNKTKYVLYNRNLQMYLSKWKIYGFLYNFIKKNFNAELLFTDTDSLTYEIKSKNAYEEFFKWKDLFDFSNYSKDSEFFDDTNKKVIGKMKDEYGGVNIDQFIGLKSKMYSIKKINGSATKGVNIATEFNEFKDVLFNKKVIRHKMKRIQAKKHKIGTYEIYRALMIKVMC